MTNFIETNQMKKSLRILSSLSSVPTPIYFYSGIQTTSSAKEAQSPVRKIKDFKSFDKSSRFAKPNISNSLGTFII